MNISVFILAAGLGERLKPITDYIPKPLIPVLGKPVLESVLERISTLSPGRTGINLHHKKEAIEDWIRRSPYQKKVHLFPEDPVLGTGGALKNAEEFLKDNTFLVHNSDIISDLDLVKLAGHHLSSENLATLAVHHCPRFNNLEIDEKGLLRHVGMAPEGSKSLAFTGIAVYRPEFLKFLPPGASGVVDAWFKAIAAGHKIGTLDVSGCYWTDIGAPASYAKAVVYELGKNGETVYINPATDWCEYTELDGYTVIEQGSTAERGVSLRNCIVLPGTRIQIREQDDAAPECLLTLFWGKGSERGLKKEFLFENCILGPGFKIDLMESEMSGPSAGEDAFLIGTGGSDRKYYRVKRNGRSAVRMQCQKDDPDFQRHIEYTELFKRHSIPVPALLETDTLNMTATFEDLGDLSLYSWLKCPRGQEQKEKIYGQVIDILVLIHTKIIAHISGCPLLQNRVFDYDHFRWETQYFIERFVKGLRGISVKNMQELDDEFHRLAKMADSFPKTVIHRDFQSQNIMITKGIPGLLDYQGARVGPPAYDVASILWDPYYRLDGGLREQLLDYYIGRAEKISPAFDENIFRKSILPCRLQRHMQALGAYGFLSSEKGKKYFLKHVPEGLRLLREEVSFSKDEYPELYALVMGLQ